MYETFHALFLSARQIDHHDDGFGLDFSVVTVPESATQVTEISNAA
jgi:hypothetical protein